MSNETIGRAVRNPDAPFAYDEGVQFRVPYGRDSYAVLINHQEMDRLLDVRYAQLLGRTGVIGSACKIELESPDLPLFAWPKSLLIEDDGISGHTPHLSMGVAIVTKSLATEHRGVLLARRHESYGAGIWEYVRYEESPLLQEHEGLIVSADERAAA